MANAKPAITAKNRRSSARLAAVQALYQMDVAQTDLDDVMAEFVNYRLGKEVEGEHMSKADVAFFQDLLAGIVREQRRLDPMIDTHLASKWRLNRIDSTLRAILRAGTYELLCRTDVPYVVVINEYVDIAHAFFEKDEPKVVNAVLQNIWKSHTQKPEPQTAEAEPVEIAADPASTEPNKIDQVQTDLDQKNPNKTEQE